MSVHRRFERFFQHVHLDGACVARLIVHIMGLAGKAVANSGELHGFTRIIKDNFSEEERTRMVEML